MRITKKLLIHIIAITTLPVYGSQLASHPNLNDTVTPATKRAAQENKDTLKKNTKTQPPSRLAHTRRIMNRIKVLYAQATKHLWGTGTFKEHRVRRIVTGITGILASIMAYYTVRTHLCPLPSSDTVHIQFPDDIVNPVDRLIYAAHKGGVTQVQELLNSDVDPADPNGVGSSCISDLGIYTNALTTAARGSTRNHVQIVQLLINKRASLNGAPLGDGETEYTVTPLHMASKFSNSPETVRLLLHAQVNPNVPTEHNVTPLHLAVERPPSDARREIVFTLLDYGADPRIENARNRTPLFYALENRPRCTDILPKLIAKQTELNAKKSE